MNSPFSAWLQAEMEKRNWTQAELARRSGLTRQAISRYLGEVRTTPAASAIDAIAMAFNIPPAKIYQELGILPGVDDPGDFEKWRYILGQLPEADRDEMLQILELRLERRRKEQNGGLAKTLRTHDTH